MGTSIDLPDWARYMTDPPDVTRYVGPEDLAVMWRGQMSRRRVQITLANYPHLSLNVAQAAVVRDMLTEAIGE